MGYAMTQRLIFNFVHLSTQGQPVFNPSTPLHLVAVTPTIAFSLNPRWPTDVSVPQSLGPSHRYEHLFQTLLPFSQAQAFPLQNLRHILRALDSKYAAHQLNHLRKVILPSSQLLLVGLVDIDATFVALVLFLPLLLPMIPGNSSPCSTEPDEMDPEQNLGVAVPGIYPRVFNSGC